MVVHLHLDHPQKTAVDVSTTKKQIELVIAEERVTDDI
jgi:hypothetical protein